MRDFAATSVVVVGMLFQVVLWIAAIIFLIGGMLGDCLYPEQCSDKGPRLLATIVIATLVSAAAAVGTGLLVRAINGPDE